MLASVFVAALLVSPSSPEAPDGVCNTPKSAVGHWLATLGKGGAPHVAAACAEKPRGWSADRVDKAVVELKEALDHRAIFIPVKDLPSDPNYVDPETGVATVAFAPGLPDLVVIKKGGRWVLSAGTLERASQVGSEGIQLNLDSVVQRMPEWAREKVFGIAPWQVMFLMLLVLLGLIVRLIVTRLLTAQLERLMARLRVTWGEELLRQASLPLGNLALAGVLALGQPSLQLAIGPSQIVALAIRVLAAFSLIHLFYRATDLLGAYMSARAAKSATKLDDQLVPIVVKAIKWATISVGLLFILQNLDIDVTSLLTGVGIGGLAFALAAKDVVGNLFGSVTIFLDQPFQIGDWVTTSGVEGTVEEVGIRSTRIRTFYNSVVSVPNGKFTDAIVDNYGRRQYRRTSTKLGLTYDTPPEKIEAFCDGARAIIKAHPLTRKDYYEVHFVGFADSALEIMLYFFFECESWSDELRGRHEVYLDLLRLADELGVSFAFPTQSLHLESVAQPRELTPPAHKTVPELKSLVDEFGPGGGKVMPPGQRVHDGFYAG